MSGARGARGATLRFGGANRYSGGQAGGRCKQRQCLAVDAPVEGFAGWLRCRAASAQHALARGCVHRVVRLERTTPPVVRSGATSPMKSTIQAAMQAALSRGDVAAHVRAPTASSVSSTHPYRANTAGICSGRMAAHHGATTMAASRIPLNTIVVAVAYSKCPL